MRVAGISLVLIVVLVFTTGSADAQRLNGDFDWWETTLLSAYDLEVTADGLVWFTTDYSLVRFTPSTGSSLAYGPLGTDNNLECLDQDSNGTLWVAEYGNDRILEFDTGGGGWSYHDIPSAEFPGGCKPYGVTAVSPTEIWFTCWGVYSLGRLDPTGPTWTRFLVNGVPLPDPPVEIAFDDEGRAWFTMRTDTGATPGFGWLDPANTTPPASGWISAASFVKPHSIVFHNDALWFVDHGWNAAESAIIRIDPATKGWSSYQLPDEVDDAHFLTVGPKGRLFTAGFVTASVALFDTETLQFQTEWLGNDDIWPMGVATAPDGRIWYAHAGPPPEFADGGVGRYTPMGPSALAVGSYESLAADKDGAVAMFYGSLRNGALVDGNQLWSNSSPGVANVPEADDLFGHAVASGDFDGDGSMDLAVGAPGKNVGAAANAGAVQVFYARRGGFIASADNEMWTQNVGTMEGLSESGDKFGWALASGDFNRDGYDDLAVSAPFEDLGTEDISDAGAVHIILGTASGLTDTGNQIWYQGILGIENTPENSDRFGESLAAGDFDGDGFDDLAIGVPRENWGTTLNDAGVVQVLYGNLDGLTWSGDQIWHQNLTEILDAMEDSDLFGQTLAAGDFDRDGYCDLAIGAPQEGYDGRNTAGVVHILPGTSSGLSSTGDQMYHQGNIQIDGVLESNDRFGWSLTTGNFNGDWYDDLAIAAPFEGIGSPTEAVAAGGVNVLYGTQDGLRASGSTWVHQDSDGIDSFVEANDRFGEHLAAGDFDDDGFDDLVVATTFEDLVDENEGVVHIIYGRLGGIGGFGADSIWFHQDMVDVQDTDEPFDRFGWSVATLGGLADVVYIDGFERGNDTRWSATSP